MDYLRDAVGEYAKANADKTGLARFPVEGLLMKRIDAPTAEFHALYPSMMCLILQGSKRMTIGAKTATLEAGDTFIITNSVPAAGAIVQASRSQPYIAVAVQIDPVMLAELVAELDAPGTSDAPDDYSHCLSIDTADAFLVDCLTRMVRLLDHRGAASVLGASTMRELHYWLLSGRHAAALRGLVNVGSRSGHLESAIAILRTEYASRLSAQRLADAAGMSLTSFHKHFKSLTAMTPGQYQKQMRLMEARRLMLDQGYTVTAAAFCVGYESASQFSRDYCRMFELPPKRDILTAQNRCISGSEHRAAAE